MIGKAHILVVEDTASIRELLGMILPYQVRFARSQEEAFRALGECAFDLVLLDLKLPRTTADSSPDRQVGIDILRIIRSGLIARKGTRKAVPVIAMTAWGDAEVASNMYSDLGISFYVEKPFGQSHELESKVERALLGEGAGVPVSKSSAIRVIVRRGMRRAQVETYVCKDTEYAIVERLAREWDGEEGISSKVLAYDLGVSEETFRKRMDRFRGRLKAHFREEISIELGGTDVVFSQSWHGFRLNREQVELIDFDRLRLTED